ncbi:ABC transporter permease [soil metagenome]
MINTLAALRSLKEGWQRAILSAVGVMVGASAIVLLVAIAVGVRADVRREVEQFGVNVLIVIPSRLEAGGMNFNLGGASYLQQKDARRLESVPGVVRTAALSFVGGGIRRGQKRTGAILVATEPSWFQMRPVTMQEGRTLDARDDGRDVCVIGSIAKDALFGGAKALDQTVTVNGRTTKVVGVTREEGQSQSLLSFGGLQNAVYLPYARYVATTPNAQTDRLMIQSAPDVEPKSLVKRLESKLGERLNSDQYQVLTQEDLLGLVYRLMSILTWLLTGLTGIALFVGGVGIMTVMLMSVNERSREIGIRKATGARRRDVFGQFLVEATIIALAGGGAGLLFAAIVCAGLARFTPVKPIITGPIVLLSFGTCLVVGTVFGLVPALNAARKNPVEALRSE